MCCQSIVSLLSVCCQCVVRNLFGKGHTGAGNVFGSFLRSEFDQKMVTSNLDFGYQMSKALLGIWFINSRVLQREGYHSFIIFDFVQKLYAIQS